MKFFHLSDLHIGLKLMNHDLSKDQEYILHKVIEAARERQKQSVAERKNFVRIIRWVCTKIQINTQTPLSERPQEIY